MKYLLGFVVVVADVVSRLVGSIEDDDVLDGGDTHGSVTFIPNILPGGNTSNDAPDSFDARRKAIASSTACCLFNAT